MNPRIVLTVALAGVLLAPAATAEWHSFGSKEPSTGFDVDTYGPTSPNTEGGHVAYFNAFPIQSHGLILASYNPNVATLDTGFDATGPQAWEVLFGVWKDCNDDGYVGIGETGETAYRAELLQDRSICPPQAATDAVLHNDGEWVYEYLIFATLDPCNWLEDERAAESGHPCEGYRQQTYNFDLPGALYVNATVWGDTQRPDFRLAEGEDSSGGSCALSPVPEGTTSSTGLLLRQLDCGTGILGLMNAATALVDPEDELDLRWDDRNHPHREDHPLNFGLPVNLYGNPVEGQAGQTGLIEENSDDPAFTYDCTRTDVHDPTGGELRRTGVRDETGVLPKEVPNPDEDPEQDGDETYELTTDDGYYLAFNGTGDDGIVVGIGLAIPSLANPTGSYYDAANRTYDGVYAPARGFDGDCDPGSRNDFPIGNGAGSLDSDRVDNSAQESGKISNDWAFRFASGFDLLSDWTIANTVDTGRAPTIPRSTWASEELIVNNLPALLPSVSVTRQEISPREPEYYTFYGRIDRNEMSTLGITVPAGDNTYGAYQCGEAASGIVNGWECDRELWFRNAASGQRTDSRYTDGTSKGARVGDPYQFRDVDCFDSRAAGVTPPTVVACE